MATNIQYSFYQVANSNTINSGYAAGAIVFNKTRKELTVFGPNNAATVYAGGLASASFEEKLLTITDFNGASVTVDLSNFATVEAVGSLLQNGYYSKTEVDNIIANKANKNDVYTKAEADNKFTDHLEVAAHIEQATYTKAELYTQTETDNKISEAVSALGTVFRVKEGVEYYDQLPMTGNENGDVRQVTNGDTTEDSISPITGIEFADNTEFFWNGTKWEILGVNEVDMSAYITTETANESFATKGELNTLQGNVTTLGQQLQNKANQSDVNAIWETIGMHGNEPGSLGERISNLEALSYWKQLD